MKQLTSFFLTATFILLTSSVIFAKNIIINNTSNVTTVSDSSSSVNTGINLGEKNTLYGIKGNGDIKIFKRKLDFFDKISISIPFEIKVVCGNKNEAAITIDSNLEQYIETKVINKNLEINTTKSFSTQNQIEVVLYAKTLSSMKISSSSNISVSGINSKDFSMNIDGACEITLTGKANNVDIDSEGASTIDAKDLKSQSTDITMSGAGSAKVYASDKLNVQIHGAADIEYYGNPKTIKKNNFFAGSLEQGQ